MTPKQRLVSMVHRFETLRTRANWAAPVLARITLGVLFMSTGWGKVHHLQQVSAYFSELAIPWPAFHATLVSYVELVGGVLLLVGLATELAAVPLAVSMMVAILTAKRAEVHQLPDLLGLVEWTYLVLLIGLVFSGAGRLSLDVALLKRGKTRRAQPELLLRDLSVSTER